MLPIWLLAAMMIMMYYWRFWEPWANAMLAILVWIENHDWHNCFCMSSWGSPLLPKLLVVWIAMKIHDWQQSCCQNSGLALKIMTGTTVFACLPGAHPYWTQKSFKIEQFYIID